MLSHLIISGALALNGLKTPHTNIIREAGIDCVVDVPVDVDPVVVHSEPIVEDDTTRTSSHSITATTVAMATAHNNNQQQNNNSNSLTTAQIMKCIGYSVVITIILVIVLGGIIALCS